MGMGGRGVAPSPSRLLPFPKCARAWWSQLPDWTNSDDTPVIVLVVVNVVAHLADAFVFQRGIHHHPAFGDVVAEGFSTKTSLPASNARTEARACQ